MSALAGAAGRLRYCVSRESGTFKLPSPRRTTRVTIARVAIARAESGQSFFGKASGDAGATTYLLA